MKFETVAWYDLFLESLALYPRECGVQGRIESAH